MLFSILNFFFTAIIIILFVRYFVEKYRFYGFGPIMTAVVTLTERLIRPLKNVTPKGGSLLDDHLPLVAIGVTLIIRGIFIWILGAGTLNDMVRIHSVGGRIPLLYAVAVSLSMGIQLVIEMLIAFLFASVMVSRRGITMGGNAGFMCFQERTFAVFRWTQKFIRSDNLMTLFLCTSIVAVLVGSFAASIVSFTFLYGPKTFFITYVLSLFDIVQALIHIYWLVLLLAIMASWIAADQFSMMIQMIRAMSDPYLSFFRRLMPWARIDFIDLSPIFAFLCLNPGLVYLLLSLRAMIVREIMTAMLFV